MHKRVWSSPSIAKEEPVWARYVIASEHEFDKNRNASWLFSAVKRIQQNWKAVPRAVSLQEIGECYDTLNCEGFKKAVRTVSFKNEWWGMIVLPGTLPLTRQVLIHVYVFQQNMSYKAPAPSWIPTKSLNKDTEYALYRVSFAVFLYWNLVKWVAATDNSSTYGLRYNGDKYFSLS